MDCITHLLAGQIHIEHCLVPAYCACEAPCMRLLSGKGSCVLYCATPLGFGTGSEHMRRSTACGMHKPCVHALQNLRGCCTFCAVSLKLSVAFPIAEQRNASAPTCAATNMIDLRVIIWRVTPFIVFLYSYYIAAMRG